MSSMGKLMHATDPLFSPGMRTRLIIGGSLEQRIMPCRISRQAGPCIWLLIQNGCTKE